MTLEHGSLRRRLPLRAMLVVAALSLPVSVSARTIYVSPNGDDANSGLSDTDPIRTIAKAKDIAENSPDPAFTILLEGGVTHDEFIADLVPLYRGSPPEPFAFAWDIDKELRLSTYGSSMYARLDGAQYNFSDGGPSMAILVRDPSSKNVVIENLFFENWQENTIMAFRTQNVTIRNIDIHNTGTRHHPDLNNSAAPGQRGYPYAAGVIYPKNSRNIKVDNVVMTECHNVHVSADALHGFYMTRLADSTISNVYMKNVSGSPLKPARAQASNIVISDVHAYWTGTTNTNGSHQPGFLRYATKSGDGCPSGIVVRDSTFWYPYCWDEHEDCSQADGQICSASSPEECGRIDDSVCDGGFPQLVTWTNTDLRTYYVATDPDVPPVPNISGWRASGEQCLHVSEKL